MSSSSIFTKRIPFFICSLLLCFASLAGQTITTADKFFTSVSEVYAGLSDYSANILISSTTTGSKTETMSGHLIFKKPDLLRIDFLSPAEQTIVFNGNLLVIYLPAPYNVTLNQTVDKNSGASGASIATPQGLSLMKRYYSIAYETGPDPIPLYEEAEETVISLLLSRRSTTELFRTIRLLISPDTKLIRQIEAQTVSGEQITFEFSKYALNQGIHNNRFEYDSPATANNFNNFLFTE